MKVSCNPSDYKPISFVHGVGRPYYMTVEEALELYYQLGLAIMDAIKDHAREARA